MQKVLLKILKSPIFYLVLFIIVLLGTFIGNGVESGDWGNAAEIAFKQILVDNFLGVTPLLLGLVTFGGYLALGRGFVQSILGLMKTAIGVIIMTTGAGLIVGMSAPIFNSFGAIIGSNVVVLDPYFGWTNSLAFLEGVGGPDFAGFAAAVVSFSMLLGLIVNILLVLFKKGTNLRAVMITGHVMFQQSAMVVGAFFVFLLFSLTASGGTIDLSDPGQFYSISIGIMFLSGITLGLYWATTTSAVAKATDKVTGNAGFSLGHQQMIGAFIAAKLGRFFGKAEDSAENRKVSKKLKIFEDNVFTQFAILFVLFFVLIMVIQFAPDPEVDSFQRFDVIATGAWNVAGGAHWVVNMVLGVAKIVAGILILVTGVRMFVTELQQSFQGIIDKVLKDGIIAVDVAATFGFAPNSVTYGFLAGTIGQYLAMALSLGISFIPGISGYAIAVPLFITLFFNSGAMGVYANSTGGWKAALIVPAIMGFVGVLTISFSLWVFNSSFASLGDHVTGEFPTDSPFIGGYIGMFDWNFVFGISMLFMGIPGAGFWIAIALMWVALLVWGQLITYTDGKNGIFHEKFVSKIGFLNKQSKKPSSAIPKK